MHFHGVSSLTRKALDVDLQTDAEVHSGLVGVLDQGRGFRVEAADVDPSGVEFVEDIEHAETQAYGFGKVIVSDHVNHAVTVGGHSFGS